MSLGGGGRRSFLCRTIASDGQVVTQSPHPMQRSSATFAGSPSAVIASIWQRVAHVPQSAQSSLSTCATKSVWKKSAGRGHFFAVVKTPQQQPQQQHTNIG